MKIISPAVSILNSDTDTPENGMHKHLVRQYRTKPTYIQ